MGWGRARGPAYSVDGDDGGGDDDDGGDTELQYLPPVHSVDEKSHSHAQSSSHSRKDEDLNNMFFADVLKNPGFSYKRFEQIGRIHAEDLETSQNLELLFAWPRLLLEWMDLVKISSEYFS